MVKISTGLLDHFFDGFFGPFLFVCFFFLQSISSQEG